MKELSCIIVYLRLVYLLVSEKIRLALIWVFLIGHVLVKFLWVGVTFPPSMVCAILCFIYCVSSYQMHIMCVQLRDV